MSIIGAFPQTLQNGTPEDATQVMALFAFIQSQVNGNTCPATTTSGVLKGDGSGGTTGAVPGTDYQLPLSGANGSAGVGHQRTATGTAVRTVLAELQDMAVSAADFTGFDASGATDSSAAVNAAIAALPAGGGTVYIPRGTPRFNVTITKPGVKLKGPGMTQDRSWTSASNYVRPWNDANPCIQVGNDSAIVAGVSIEDVTFYGATTGAIGIYFAGGAFRCAMTRVSAYEFTTNNFKFKGGATYPCSLIFCNALVSQSTVAGNEGVLVDGNVATYTTAVYLNGAHLSIGTSGHALANDSCSSMFVSNVYIDAGNLTGVIIRNTKGGAQPFISANGFSIDSASNTDVLLESTFSTSLHPEEYVRGVWTLDGKLKNSAGTTAGPFTGGDSMLFTPLLRSPLIDGTIYFPDPTTDPNWYSDTSASVSASGAGSSRQMTVSSNRTSIMSAGASQDIRLGAGGTYVFGVETYGFVPLADGTLNLGDSSLRYQYAFAKTFRPGTGVAQWTSGAGTPEGVLAAPIGSLYTRTDGGAATTLYVKESGGGNTGWVAK